MIVQRIRGKGLGAALSVLVSISMLYAEDNTTQVYDDGGTHGTSDIVVGNTGTNNSLSISNTTTVNTTGTAIIGSAGTADNNFATVADDSTWTVSSFMFVGENGSDNVLTIQDGSLVTVGSTFDVGRFVAAQNNSVVITGADSTLQLTGANFAVGRNGSSNSITVSAGGLLNSSSGATDIGHASSNNSVTVTGTDSQWLSSTLISVGASAGFSGNQLIVSDGGNVTAPSLFVGHSGPGSLTLDTGGTIALSSIFLLGRLAGSDGSSGVITGAGTTLSAGGTAFWFGGQSNSNTMMIADQAVVTSNVVADIGNTGDNNVTTVTGSGTQWNSSGIIVGTAAAATGNQLIVSDGAKVMDSGSIFIGESGSNNSLSLTSGGTITITAGNFLIGRLSGANGNSALVTGAGTTLNAGGSAFWLGGQGSNNTMTIADQAVVNSTVAASIGAVGDNNITTVTGSGTQWNAAGITVGESSGADGNQLIVSNGAKVLSGSIFVGQFGSGNSMTVSGGGEVAATGGHMLVGHNGGTNNSVLVTGPGSLTRGNFFLYVGFVGTNSNVSVTNGGTLQFNNYDIGLSGSGTVSNTGGVYQFTTAAPSITIGTGSMTMNGGTVSYKGVSGANINNAQVNLITRSGNNTFRLDNSTGASIASYTFAANTSSFQKLELLNGSTWNGTNLTIGAGGELVGNGSINAATVIGSQGSVAPGMSIGTITITGGLTLNGAYDLEAIVENQFTDVADLLIVNGLVDVTGATLNVSMLSTFGGPTTTSLVIIQNDGVDAVIGTFATLNSHPSVQFTIDYAYAGPGGDGNDVAILFTQVPEPAGMTTLAIGALALSLRHKRWD